MTMNILLVALEVGTETLAADKRRHNTTEAEDMAGDNVHESEGSGAKVNQDRQACLFSFFQGE